MFHIALLIFVVVYLLFRVYIKFVIQFWSQQPVFHWYDLHHYLTTHRRVEASAPPIDKYVNLIDIKTSEVTSHDELKIFLEEHGLQTFDPIGGENNPVFLSSYHQQGKIYGVLTAHPLYIRFKGQAEIAAYYAKHLCVHRGMRQKGIAHQLIRTHYYKSRRLKPEVDVFLFKRRGKQRSLVSFVTYHCVKFATGILIKRPFPDASNTLIEINKDKLPLFFTFVRIQKMRFECVILPDLAALAHRLEHNIWNIYGILEGDRVKAVYIFHHDGTLIASIDACEFVELFQIGFEQACGRIESTSITIHQIGHSLRLCGPRYYSEKYAESYYLYNFVTNPQKSESCLILN